MPQWLKVNELVYFHRELIREHGGLMGIRNSGALEAALARPRQRLHYEPGTTICELAASYGYGIARSHVFADGNKRIALVAIDVFLQLNGLTLVADEAETVVVITELAAGMLDESELAVWITENAQPFYLAAD